MRTNVTPTENYYYIDCDRDIMRNHTEVMNIVKEYLEKKSTAKNDELGTIFDNIEKYKNFVCKFDNYTEMEKYGKIGRRVAYGAFRHEAVVHDVQQMWSYTFEILDIGDQYYIGINQYGWLADDDLRKKVSNLLE